MDNSRRADEEQARACGPLSPQVQKVLGGVLSVRMNQSPFVFSTNNKSPLSGFSKFKRKIDQAMLADARAEDANAVIEPWTLHDLRRTAVTGMVEIGVEPHVVEAVVNHISGHKSGVAGVYNVANYAEQKRRALERWAAHIERVIAGEASGTVLPMRGRR
jgi:integrase